jgi:hypothetical protein
MKILDTLCAWVLFVVALLDCLTVPRTYTGRIWIFGTGLALLFTAMLNLLRIRNDAVVVYLRPFCFTANIAMLTFALGLIASIGKARTLQHFQIPFVATLVFAESAFSLYENL